MIAWAGWVRDSRTAHTSGQCACRLSPAEAAGATELLIQLQGTTKTWKAREDGTPAWFVGRRAGARRQGSGRRRQRLWGGEVETKRGRGQCKSVKRGARDWQGNAWVVRGSPC